MPHQPLSADTSPEIEARQIDAWRRMTSEEKAAIVRRLTKASIAMARAGVRHRYPDASPREQFLRLAIVRLGVDLARRAYPEIDALTLE